MSELAVGFQLNYTYFRYPSRFLLTLVIVIGLLLVLTQQAPDYPAFMLLGVCAVFFLLLAYTARNALAGFSPLISGLLLVLLAAIITAVVFFFQDQLLFAIEHYTALPWGNSTHAPMYFLAFVLLVVPVSVFYEHYRYVLSEYKQQARSTDVKDLDLRIRPHFLFNSLNSVAGLIHEDPDRAEAGLIDLADMFRIIMTDKRQSVPLSAELDMAKKYVSLEKIRLGDRLKVIWELQGVDKSIVLPILTLQPLIENAIYHGIETRLRGGVIAIKARNNEGYVFISIINPVPKSHQPVRKGNQIAQKNLKDRLKYAYDGKASINVMQTENYYTVTLKLPRTLTEA